MNQMPPLPTQDGFHHQRDVDGVLRRFFRAEMPDPWPELNLPEPAPVVRGRFNFVRAGGRLALAASIMLAVVGYLALGGLFPQEKTPSEDNARMPGTLGQLDSPPTMEEEVQTRRKVKARMKVNVIPGFPGERPKSTTITLQPLTGGQK